MSAIKRFFEEERSRKERIREKIRRARRIQQEVYVVDQSKLDRAYKTLLNWKLYFVEDLLAYYNELDQEEYEYILEKKDEFPKHIQDILWTPIPIRAGLKSKLKQVDMTDKMYSDAKFLEQTNFEKKIAEELAKREIPIRPANQLDTDLDEHRKKLKDQEDQLEKLMKAPTKKYVAPSMRKQAMLSDPAVQNMQKQIEKTKNEILVCEKYVADANNGWTESKRFEFRQKIVQEMYAV